MNGTTLLLESKLDLRSVEALKSAILETRGHDLTLDAGQVTQIGALSVQVIRSAAKTWAGDDKTLQFINASNECEDQMNLLGFTSKTICKWEAA